MERAVWNVIWPSTFCTIWWIWPFSTVTEPKRRDQRHDCRHRRCPSPRAHRSSRAAYGRTPPAAGWRSGRPDRPSARPAARRPSAPRPLGLKFITLIRATKCTPCMIEAVIALVARGLAEAAENSVPGPSVTSCSPGTVCSSLTFSRDRSWLAVSNSAGLERWVTSPVWMARPAAPAAH